MVLFPNAKINLGLNITEKRPDGYHNIETCFFPIAICDILEFIETKGETTFESSGISIPGNARENLCMQAWKLIKDEYDIPPVKIFLHKQIPIGAGLGGGSSDAAYMLRGLNDYFKLNIEPEKLEVLASKLGSDCSFFIRNVPCFATGRGEILTPIELNIKGYKILLVNPGIHVGTSEAYAQVHPKQPEFSLSQSLKLPLDKWVEFISNDFEAGVFKKHPKIAQIKESIINAGAVYASMSGSGSSVYGIFVGDIPDKLEKEFSDMYFWRSDK
jgi:4-diphosphocytidyl-2-C-methyl-D-erythritol kinase